jgi:Na+-transporting methylmalonyl-CoA/oxaloacetate decarboxylase gamma subunit
MASASEDNENHWPGYVDALTTMTMMLIFVMMILAVAMFSMSESVSRSMVERIAQAAGIEVDAESRPIEEFAKEVAERIEDQKATLIARAEQALPGQTLPGEEKRIASLIEARRANPDAPVQVETKSPALLTFAFKPRAVSLDESAESQMKGFLASGGHIQGAGRFDLRAYASAELGGISDSRRVAYHRAMTVRARLIGMGVPAQRIAVHVEDRPLERQAELLQVFVR